MESDPRLRSTIVTLILLTGPRTGRSDRAARAAQPHRHFRKRVVSSPSGRRALELDPTSIHFHLRRVSAAAPGSIDTLLEMARVAAMRISTVPARCGRSPRRRLGRRRSRLAVQAASCAHRRRRRHRYGDDVVRPHRAVPAAPDAGGTRIGCARAAGHYPGLLSYEAGQAASVLTGSVKAAPNASSVASATR